MFRTLSAFLPRERRRNALVYGLVTVFINLANAVAALLLLPFIQTIFSENPADAWPWLGAIAAATVLAWALSWWNTSIAVNLGQDILGGVQEQAAGTVSRIRNSWFNATTMPRTRRALSDSILDLSGLALHLITPLLNAFLMPLFIAVGLYFVDWRLGLAGTVGFVLLVGGFWASRRITLHSGDVSDVAYQDVTARTVEFSRTQQALRASRRIEPENSHVGDANDTFRGTYTKMLLWEIPANVLFSFLFQLALLIFIGVTVYVNVTTSFTHWQSIAMIVVMLRFMAPFTTLGDLASAFNASSRTLRDLQSVIDPR